MVFVVTWSSAATSSLVIVKGEFSAPSARPAVWRREARLRVLGSAAIVLSPDGPIEKVVVEHLERFMASQHSAAGAVEAAMAAFQADIDGVGGRALLFESSGSRDTGLHPVGLGSHGSHLGS